MRDFIKNKLHNTLLVDQQVDFNLNNKSNDELKEECICNQMNINNIEQGLKLLNKALGSKTQNPDDWNKIVKPLEMWSKATSDIRNQYKDKMTGDSEVDESDTWWHGIQNAFCK